MRSEQEMMRLILETAEADPRIRAVVMNGSRVNPNAPRDIFQDYDVVYVVTEVAPFANNLDWIERFGELMIVQMPEPELEPPPGCEPPFTYLMQFADGNRIDLAIMTAEHYRQIESDSLTIVLLDKDGVIGTVPPPDESDYLPEPPASEAYDRACNEFWWVSTYVAKGLWRREITYARGMMDQVVRQELMRMLTWYVGVKFDFTRNPGKQGKYLEQCLGPELWEMLLATYADADYDNTWDALFTMGALFRYVARVVADSFDYEYPEGDDARVTAHLRNVRRLPAGASTIY